MLAININYSVQAIDTTRLCSTHYTVQQLRVYSSSDGLTVCAKSLILLEILCVGSILEKSIPLCVLCGVSGVYIDLCCGQSCCG